MWEYENTDTFKKRWPRYEKKYPAEAIAALKNLEKYWQAVKSAPKASHVNFGFIHNEGKGVVALDQSGSGPAASQFRLYCYPDEDSETLYLLTVGDKKTQSQDIKHCHEFVDSIRKQ